MSADRLASEVRARQDALRALLHEIHPSSMVQGIEQISLFLLLRSLSEADEILTKLDGRRGSVSAGDFSHWDAILDADDATILNTARKAICGLHKQKLLPVGMTNAFRSARLSITDRTVLRAVVKQVSAVDLGQPDAEQTFFQRLCWNVPRVDRHFGTPSHIAKLLVDLLAPRIGDRICDPACGSGELILNAHRELTNGRRLIGQEWQWLERDAFAAFDDSPLTVRLAAMNFYFNGVTPAVRVHTNSRTDNERFDVVMSDLSVPGAVRRFQWTLQHLKAGGKAGVIIPAEAVTAERAAMVSLRGQLLASMRIEGLINLPSGSFAPYSGRDMAIVLFSRNRPTTRVWMFDVYSDGYSLDARRLPVADDDIPRALEAWWCRRVRPNRFIKISEVTGQRVRGSKAVRSSSTILREMRAVELTVRQALSSVPAEYQSRHGVTIGSLCHLLVGAGRPSAGERGALGDLAWLCSSDVLACNGEVLRTERSVHAEAVEELGSAVVRAGTIVISRHAGGAVAISKLRAALADDMFAVLPKKRRIQVGYLRLFLAESIRSRRMNASSRLSLAFLASLKVPMPPVAQQRAILQQLAQLDQALALRKRVIRQTDELADAVYDRWLNATAVTELRTVPLGRLVERVVPSHEPIGRNEIWIKVAGASRRCVVAMADTETLPAELNFVGDAIRLQVYSHVDATLLTAALRHHLVIARINRLFCDAEPSASSCRALLSIPVTIPATEKGRLASAIETIRAMRDAFEDSALSLLRLRRRIAKHVLAREPSLQLVFRLLNCARRNAIASQALVRRVKPLIF